MKTHPQLGKVHTTLLILRRETLRVFPRLSYFVWEALLARTPGKMVSLTRVVNLRGVRPSVWQIFVRSAVRIFLLDLFFLPFLGVTLHDYLSKTRVVQNG